MTLREERVNKLILLDTTTTSEFGGQFGNMVCHKMDQQVLKYYSINYPSIFIWVLQNNKSKLS